MVLGGCGRWIQHAQRAALGLDPRATLAVHDVHIGAPELTLGSSPRADRSVLLTPEFIVSLLLVGFDPLQRTDLS